MLLSLDSGSSALQQYQEQLNVIANNIANVNTYGFKASSVSFADALSETLGTKPVGVTQVGTGVTTSAISTDFSTPGTFANMGAVQTDLAIDGNGFFVVKDPTSGSSYVTRDGSFKLDSSGYMINANGLRLQGASGDIQITGSGSASIDSYSIGSDGSITVNLSDGTTSSAGPITLQTFTSPNQLIKQGDNLYTATAAAGGLTTAAAPGSSGTGSIKSGFLELSNVDLASQLTSLITTQRAYEANSRVITTSDNVLQTLVNLIH